MKFRFRLTEAYEEDPQLVEDVQEARNEKLDLLDQVREILTKEDFKEEKKLNGISFTKTFNIDGLEFRAQMYIDTTTFDYTTYVQEETDKHSTNYTSKGDYTKLVNAAKRFVFEISGI